MNTESQMLQNIEHQLTLNANVYRRMQPQINEQITQRTHRTNQQLIGSMVFGLIEAWAEQWNSGNYDARNAATCELSARIVGELKSTPRGWNSSMPYI